MYQFDLSVLERGHQPVGLYFKVKMISFFILNKCNSTFFFRSVNDTIN